MDFVTWGTKANLHWSRIFPRCELRGRGCSGKIWRRIRAWHSGTWFQGAWYCAPPCLEKALRQILVEARPPIPARPVPHRIPLGLLLLSRGQITSAQLRSALAAQRSSGQGRIGHWLEQLGGVTEAQITAALGLQWACPVLPSFTACDFSSATLLPFTLLEKFRMLPLQFVASTRILYVAFSQGIDYPALHAVEGMLDCRTEASLLRQSTMDCALERMGQERHPHELLFEHSRDAAETTRISCGYVHKLGAWEVRIASCGAYLWLRLESRQGYTHLLFRRPSPAQQDPAPALANSSRRQTTANRTERELA